MCAGGADNELTHAPWLRRDGGAEDAPRDDETTANLREAVKGLTLIIPQDQDAMRRSAEQIWVDTRAGGCLPACLRHLSHHRVVSAAEPRTWTNPRNLKGFALGSSESR
jgi:hypothetical protein